MDMRDMSERLADAVLIAGMVTAMLVVAFWWLQPPETTDDFTITIDCRAVIMNYSEFSENIVMACRDKVRFIKPTEQPTV